MEIEIKYIMQVTNVSEKKCRTLTVLTVICEEAVPVPHLKLSLLLQLVYLAQC